MTGSAAWYPQVRSWHFAAFLIYTLCTLGCHCIHKKSGFVCAPGYTAVLRAYRTYGSREEVSPHQQSARSPLIICVVAFQSVHDPQSVYQNVGSGSKVFENPLWATWTTCSSGNNRLRNQHPMSSKAVQVTVSLIWVLNLQKLALGLFKPPWRCCEDCDHILKHPSMPNVTPGLCSSISGWLERNVRSPWMCMWLPRPRQLLNGENHSAYAG